MVDRDKALDMALGQIEKQFGKGSIMKLGAEAVAQDVSAVSTGSLALDIALGVGGVPRGRVIEIYGPESSGKTTLSLQIVAEAQKLGGTCAFVDAEHALDTVYAKKLGVQLEDLLIAQPDNGVTYASKIEKSEARIDWSASAQELDRKIRGLSPFPGAWCLYKGERLKLLASVVAQSSGEPGEVLDDDLTVACGDGAVEIKALQRAGKGAQPRDVFLRGMAIRKGERLG